MSALIFQLPYPSFFGRDGLPLKNGYVWIGAANLEPRTNPVAVYYDAALTIPAAQPLRTVNGFVSRAGSPAQVYIDASSFSILVQDSKALQVWTEPNAAAQIAKGEEFAAAAAASADESASSATDSQAAAASAKFRSARQLLRRGFTNKRLSGEYLGNLATATLNAAKKTTGGGVDLWEPDASATYNAVWILDMSMCMHEFPEYFSSTQLAGAFNWYRSFCNLTTYEVPSHVALDGTIYWTPGSTNDWGSRAPTDGNTMLLQIAWLHFQKSGDPTLYNTHKTFLYNLLNVGIPYNATTKCVHTPDVGWFNTFGYTDTVRLTGSVLTGSILAYVAWLQLADMADAAGDEADANVYILRAMEIKDGINANLWVESGMPGMTGQTGMYRAATGLNSAQLDVWGSALAVYTGVADEGRALKISKMFVDQYAVDVSGKKNFIVYGGVRHVMRIHEHTPGVQVWEAMHIPPAYEDYMNGGYWSTPVAWVAATLALTSPDTAADFCLELKKTFEYDKYGVAVSKAPAEWWDYAHAVVGAPNFCTSACAPMQIEAQMFTERMPKAFLGLDPAKVVSGASAVIPPNTFVKLPFESAIKSEFGVTPAPDFASSVTYSALITEAGWYRVAGMVSFLPPSIDPARPVTVRRCLLRLYVDGAPSLLLDQRHVVSGTGYLERFALSGERLIYLPALSVLDLRVWTSTANIEIEPTPEVPGYDYNYLTIEKV